jgi:(p)ppGpp synthase/HD superfamily hydrolase
VFDIDIERALRAAVLAHADQTRKGSDLPYATHPAHVALILARVGASTNAIQAGLLHDVVEDCDDWTDERVASEFGDDVAAIVAELTEEKGKTWEERKLTAASKAETISAEGALVKAADQLHNLSTLLEALREADDPAVVWAGFKGGRDETIRMARLLVAALSGRCDPRVTGASEEALDEIQSLSS